MECQELAFSWWQALESQSRGYRANEVGLQLRFQRPCSKERGKPISRACRWWGDLLKRGTGGPPVSSSSHMGRMPAPLWKPHPSNSNFSPVSSRSTTSSSASLRGCMTDPSGRDPAPNTVRIVAAGKQRKNGGGQDARATVVRASCPEPSIANQSANRTVLGPRACGAQRAQRAQRRTT